jgi:transposase
MREATITMSIKEQQRSKVLTRLIVGEVTAAEAAVLLDLSERQVWRLKARLVRDGPAGLVHGNRGRPSPRRIPDVVRARVVELARTTYDGANDSHLAELLTEEQGLTLSRQSVQRLLRAAGQRTLRPRRRPRHRGRRDRMPQEGLLVQADGSRHDWLGDRGPRLTLIGIVDDATGTLLAATFRAQEDTTGYLVCLRDMVRRYGVPAALYRDRHTLFEASRTPLSLEEQLADTRTPTQLGRALGELGITSIAAQSPQAKGRIERAWGTLQDRLVFELRRAGAADLASANVVLARYIPRFNRRFRVAARNAEPAWRPVPPGLRLDHVCSFRYRRVVANDHTIRAGATILQLPPGPGRRGYARTRVELQLRLDGRLVVWDGERELASVPAPDDPAKLRSLHAAKAELTVAPPSRRDHPWRRIEPGSKLARQIQERERLTKSVSS